MLAWDKHIESGWPTLLREISFGEEAGRWKRWQQCNYGMVAIAARKTHPLFFLAHITCVSQWRHSGTAPLVPQAREPERARLDLTLLPPFTPPPKRSSELKIHSRRTKKLVQTREGYTELVTWIGGYCKPFAMWQQEYTSPKECTRVAQPRHSFYKLSFFVAGQSKNRAQCT